MFVALVFGLQGRSVTGVVFVFVGLSFLDFNSVFLDLSVIIVLVQDT